MDDSIPAVTRQRHRSSGEQLPHFVRNGPSLGAAGQPFGGDAHHTPHLSERGGARLGDDLPHGGSQLLVRKRPGLWCAWAAYFAVYIFCYYGTRISWNLFFFTFSWEEVGTPVYTFAAWIQSLMILALLIGTVRSFCTFSFPPTRRNGVILVVLWIEFLAYRLLTAPIADLLSAPEIPVTSMWALMALILMAGIASLILLAIVLTLSVRMAAAWRASHC